MISLNTKLPLPPDWSKIYSKMIELQRKNNDKNIPKPPTPLILSGASVSTPSKIRGRWRDHIEWINKYGFYEEIKNLLPAALPDYDVAEKIAGLPEGYWGSKWEAEDKLFYGAEWDEIDKIRYALEYGISIEERDGEGKTPLIVAAENLSLNSLKYLINKGANPNQEVPMGYDYQGMTSLCATLISGGVGDGPDEEKHNIVLVLLNAGASVNRACRYFSSPLALACAGGMLETVKVLIECGADVEWSGKDCFPLSEAIRDGPRHNEIVSFLLKHKANRRREDLDGSGDIAIHLAAQFGNIEIAKLLLKSDSSIQVNYQNKEGETPLHIAAIYEQYDFYKFLLNKGADESIKNNEGKTALTILKN